ncbi:MAG: SLC13 family permease [Thermodesulfovibrionales bacterium]|nr:SLC13 family permease [Thermodesulfovibrionales bacterium]
MSAKEKDSKHPEGLPPPPAEITIHELEEGEKPPKSTKFVATWVLIAVAAGIAVYLLPTPEGLSDRGHKFLALLVTIVILWTSEAISIGITAIAVGAGLILFGIQPLAKAWQSYAHPAVVFVFTIIMLGVIISQTTLPNRILGWVLRVGGRKPLKLSFTLCMASTFLSAWTHDAAITIILMFSILPMFLKMGLTPAKSNNLTKHFLLMIPLGAACGGGGTFIGSGRSPAAAEMFFAATGYQIGFTEYAIYQMLPSMIYGLGTWIAVTLVFPPKIKELPEAIVAEKLPPLTSKEKGLSIAIVIALILWILSDLTKVHVSVVGAGFIIAVMLFGLVSWKKCLAEFPWNPMMVFGAGFALGIAMLDTGAGKWIAEQIFPIFEGAPWPVVSFGVGWISSIITSFMANAAATALIVPVVVPMADMAGIPTFPIAMTVPLATTFVLLVIGCPPTLIAYGLGYFTQVEAFKVFFVRTIICLLMASLVQAVWWPIAGMPGNLDMMQTPAKLTTLGVELISK